MHQISTILATHCLLKNCPLMFCFSCAPNCIFQCRENVCKTWHQGIMNSSFYEMHTNCHVIRSQLVAQVKCCLSCVACRLTGSQSGKPSYVFTTLVSGNNNCMKILALATFILFIQFRWCRRVHDFIIDTCCTPTNCHTLCWHYL